MINTIREALITKAEASRKFRSGPSPNFVITLEVLAVLTLVLWIGVAL